jgi:hypothetical protein
MRRALGFHSGVGVSVVGVATGLAALLVVGRARAVETRADVETDHVSAADDGGPRRVGVFLNPLPAGIGWLGGEVDAAFSEHVVIAVEGDTRAYGTTGYAAGIGPILFAPSVAFHGFYVHPSANWSHEAAFGATATGFGGAFRAGYEWTALYGATLRMGAGLSYLKGTVAGDGQSIDIGGIQPLFDADIGWVF